MLRHKRTLLYLTILVDFYAQIKRASALPILG